MPPNTTTNHPAVSVKSPCARNFVPVKSTTHTPELLKSVGEGSARDTKRSLSEK